MSFQWQHKHLHNESTVYYLWSIIQRMTNFHQAQGVSLYKWSMLIVMNLCLVTKTLSADSIETVKDVNKKHQDNFVDMGNSDIDPFDMINFDPTSRKMKKVPKPSHESSPNQDTHVHEGKQAELDLNKETSHQSKESPKTESNFPFKDKVSSDVCSSRKETPLSCPALPLFQQFVARLLLLVGPKVQKHESALPMCLSLVLSPKQLEALESFKKDNSHVRLHEVHEVLTQAITGAYLIDPDNPQFHTSWLEDKIGFSYGEALQIVSILALGALLVLLLVKLFGTILLIIPTRIHPCRLLIWWIFSLCFIVSVVTTWFRLYKGEIAKQHDAMMKDLPRGCTKLNTSSGIMESLYNVYSNIFTFKKDECLEYYEHLFIDPLVKVSIMEALAVAVVQMFLKPMRTIGEGISEFLRALLKDLPVQWQIPAFILAAVLPILLMFICSGYTLRIPFLLAIEPSSHKKSDLKVLQQSISQLHCAVENIGASGSLHSVAEFSQQERVILTPPVQAQTREQLEQPLQERIALQASQQRSGTSISDCDIRAQNEREKIIQSVLAELKELKEERDTNIPLKMDSAGGTLVVQAKSEPTNQGSDVKQPTSDQMSNNQSET